MGAVTVKVDGSGRVVIPKDLREQLGIPDGGELQLSVRDGALYGATRLAGFLRLRSKLAGRGAGTGAVDALLAERRAEAGREGA
ncbi:MAG: Antidote-toxin recognition MazE, bacterial antitoxin [Belnapia sp.]|jgi:AbrB family looped-hinge helix DNA binding protein|nr:Antidote-toxin recognition MazE, bacterial antitoxin [Belnapia sp.]